MSRVEVVRGQADHRASEASIVQSERKCETTEGTSRSAKLTRFYFFCGKRQNGTHAPLRDLGVALLEGERLWRALFLIGKVLKGDCVMMMKSLTSDDETITAHPPSVRHYYFQRQSSHSAWTKQSRKPSDMIA